MNLMILRSCLDLGRLLARQPEAQMDLTDAQCITFKKQKCLQMCTEWSHIWCAFCYISTLLFVFLGTSIGVALTGSVKIQIPYNLG